MRSSLFKFENQKQRNYVMEKTFNWKRPEVLAMVITFSAGILIHLFGLVNVLQNYDNAVVQPYGYGISIHSGRWALLFCGRAMELLFGGYNLPWLNGVLFVFFVALTAGVIVSVFNIKSQKAAALIGLIFISFPSAASTLLFKYTAHFDALALFAAVLAVWFLEKYKYGIIPAVLSISFSLGIYQAYIPATISIFVLLLIKQILSENIKISRVILRGLYYCAVLILGLLLYYLVLKVMLARFDASLLPYQGINEMGKISLAELPSLILKAFLGGCTFPVTQYATLAQTAGLKAAYLALWGIIILTLIYIAVAKKKDLYQVILLILLSLTFPVAVNFVAIMCPNATVYTLMVYSFALIPCIPLIFQDALPEATGILKKIQRALVVFSVGIILFIVTCNAYGTNTNYTSAYYDTCQTENYICSIATQIRLTKGFTPDKKWAALGNINDPLLDGTWDNVPLYGGISHSTSLVSTYGFPQWLRLYLGYLPPWASEDEVLQLAGNEVVINMPVWPSEGSIQIVDDYVVIKFE